MQGRSAKEGVCRARPADDWSMQGLGLLQGYSIPPAFASTLSLSLTALSPRSYEQSSLKGKV